MGQNHPVVLCKYSSNQDMQNTTMQYKIKLSGHESPSSEITDLSNSAESAISSGVSTVSSEASNSMIRSEPATYYENKSFEEMPDEKLSRSGSSTTDNAFDITWSNLSYFVKSRWYQCADQKKFILNGMSGRFSSGNLSAILGPSGAGKSTLVDCLLDKVDRDSLTGTTRVEFYNQVLTNERRLKIAIIPQKDHMFDTLTVNETLMFASRIKNSKLNWTERDHAKKVSEVLNLLGLGMCGELRCNQLSGGQYKRTSIAHELVTSPDVMILDEPTSGLDSVTCYDIVKALRSLIEANPNPMSIIVTIHQPDRETFSLFDHVYVLATGGRCVYEGPHSQILPTIRQALDTVAELKLSSEYDGNYSIGHNWEEQNPARLLVECAAHKHGYALVSTMNAIQKRAHANGSRQNLPKVFEMNGSSKPMQDEKVAIPIQDQHQESVKEIDYKYQHKARLDKRLSLRYRRQERRSFRCWLKHCGEHTRRSWLTIIRDPMLFTLQLILHIIVPLMISYAFYGHQPDGCPLVGPVDLVDAAYSSESLTQDLQQQARRTLENVGYLFFQIYVIVFSAICMTSLTYPLAAQVLLKEYRNGWYDISSYFIGRTMADIPFTAALAAMAIGISYHLTGQPWSPYDWRFLAVTGLTILCNLVAQTHGLLCGALLMNYVSSAVFVAPTSTCPMVIVCGFLLRIKLMPWLLQILSELSYFTHLLRGIVIATYGFDRCPCDPSDFEANNDHVIPSSTRNMVSFWVDSYRNEYETATNATQSPADVVEKIVETVARARTFGYNITSCDQMKSFPMLDFDFNDSDIIVSFIALAVMVVLYRVATFMILSWKIRSCV